MVAVVLLLLISAAQESQAQGNNSLLRSEQNAAINQLLDEAQGEPLTEERVRQILAVLPEVRALAADAKILAPSGQNTNLNEMVRRLEDSVFGGRFRTLLIGGGFATPELFLQASHRLFVAYATHKDRPNIEAMRAKTLADFEQQLAESNLSDERKQRARDQYLPAVQIYFSRLMNNPDVPVVAALQDEIKATISAMEQSE
ncbi:hypothetical protein ACTL6U_14210 [Rhodovibrionaceae bacterium A322]